MKIIICSPPAALLGHGQQGGVEYTLQTVAKGMQQRGHQVMVLIPEGSQMDPEIPAMPIAGTLQTSLIGQSRTRRDYITSDALLINMWERVRQLQSDYDVILNLAYDWLPFYLTPFLHQPVAHVLTNSSNSNEMDQIIARTVVDFPGSVSVGTQAQAKTYPCAEQLHCIGRGADLSRYEFQAEAQGYLAWAGRISPEKGLKDAFAVAAITQRPLKVMGVLQDDEYWQECVAAFPQAQVEYLGFLSTHELQKHLGLAQALLFTSHWMEAFGIVMIEALACGVPVIAYNHGGPTEVVLPGENGFLVNLKDGPQGLAQKVAKAGLIARINCRKSVEQRYSREAFCQRVENWLNQLRRSASHPVN